MTFTPGPSQHCYPLRRAVHTGEGDVGTGPLVPAGPTSAHTWHHTMPLHSDKQLAAEDQPSDLDSPLCSESRASLSDFECSRRSFASDSSSKSSSPACEPARGTGPGRIPGSTSRAAREGWGGGQSQPGWVGAGRQQCGHVSISRSSFPAPALPPGKSGWMQISALCWLFLSDAHCRKLLCWK